MKTEIEKITIINSRESKFYCIGSIYYGLMLDKIEDNSVNLDNSFTSMFIGTTKEGALVFELINVPIKVEYIKVEDEN